MSTVTSSRAAWTVAFFAVALAGCSGGAASDADLETSAALGAATFVPMLRCDGGAAGLDQSRETVDVQSIEASGVVDKKVHRIQFVVRDRETVARMSAQVAHITSPSGEIILRGMLDDGVAFDFFEDWSMGRMESRPEGNKTRIREGLGAVVHRVHGETDKVRLVFNRTRFTDTCATYFEEDHCARQANGGPRVDVQTKREDVPVVDAVFRCVAP